MAEKKVYIGSVGPFLYDDANPIDDTDGDFSGSNYQGILTDGGIQTTKTAADPNDVVRYGDISADNWSASKTLASGNVSLDVGADLHGKQIEQLVLSGDAGGSTLQSIAGGAAGQIIIFECTDANVTFEHSGTKAGGTIYLDNAGADIVSIDEMTLVLICVGGNYWKELSSTF